jgi:hypothetical protein
MHFTGSVSLRPVRIGFLVPPDDLSIVSRVARLSACLWGGRYNPIIPFFESGGDHWLRPYSDAKGIDIARGYVNFFEPDILVETTPGMAEKLGWQNTRRIMGLPRVVSLDQFYGLDHRAAVQFAAGVDILEVMLELYDKEYKYERRHKQPFAKIAETEGDAFFDLVCGRHAADEALEYIRRAYDDVFSPTPLPANATTALRHLMQELPGPLWITGHALQESFVRSYRDQTFYVFDPTIPGDAIDYWNFRLIERRAIPINANWFGDYTALMRERIEKVFRPIPGNPFGTKFHSTVCFASSISEEKRIELTKQHLSGLPDMAFFPERSPTLWHRQARGVQRRETKILATGKPVTFDEESKSDGVVKIPAPSPKFLNHSERYTKGRWINVIVPTNSYRDDTPAIVYPSNLWSPVYPALATGARLRVAREGWILELEHGIGYSLLHLQTGREAIIGWLEAQGIEAKPSEAGQIATQVIVAAGGLLASGMFADRATLNLLGKMAESHAEISRDGKRVAKAIPDRSMHVNAVRRHFAEREKRSFGFWNRLDHFLERSVFRAGLRVQCPICGYQNWLDLDAISYRPTCTRCLNRFAFSQLPAQLHNVDWFYRVVGPFAAPDFACGGYAVALTLRCLAEPHDTEVTWSTGLELESLNCEVDFMAWYRGSHLLNDERDEPQLVVGEAKSFGRNAITAESIANLKKVAGRFPGAFMVVSSLREIGDYSPEEIVRLRELAQWGRSSLHEGLPQNPLIVLTAVELFAQQGIFEAWKDANPNDEVHPSVDPQDLETLAQLTQRRYLGLLSYWEEQMQQRSFPAQRQRLLALIRARAQQGRPDVLVRS